MREDLSLLERRLVSCVARGEVLDCSVEGETPDDVDAVDGWDERLVRADVVAQLAVGPKADRATGMPRSGVRLRGAFIGGRLDLAHADVDVPLVFEVCRFDEPVALTGARVCSLTLTGCELPALTADELETAHTLRLDRCTFNDGPLRLVGANVAGELVLAGAKLTGTDERGQAFVGHRLRVGAASFGPGFEAAGAVRLPGATVDSYLDMKGAKLGGTDDCGRCFDAVRLRVGDEASLSGGFETAGAVAFRGAHIGGNLDLAGAKLLGADADGNAFVGDGLQVGGGARLRAGFEAAGAVRLWGAEITSQLDLQGARLTRSDANGDALVADELHVRANALLTDGFEAAGALGFRGATSRETSSSTARPSRASTASATPCEPTGSTSRATC